MNAPSKPVLIALAGVAGLVVVVGGVLWLRSRASPEEALLVPEPVSRSSSATSSTAIDQEASSSTASDLPDGKGEEIPRDSDGDGLSDEEESRIGANVFLRDTDGDGITDYEEVRVQHTDPLLFQVVVPQASPAPPPVPESSPVLDSDHDGLTDQDEVKYHTDPLNSDTDRDGYPDGSEIQKGYNPLGSGTCARPSCLP